MLTGSGRRVAIGAVLIGIVAWINGACAPSDRVTTVVVQNRCGTDVWVRFAGPNASIEEMQKRAVDIAPAGRTIRDADSIIHVHDGKRPTMAVSESRDVVGKITPLPPDRNEEIRVALKGDLCPGQSTAGG